MAVHRTLWAESAYPRPRRKRMHPTRDGAMSMRGEVPSLAGRTRREAGE